jgi:outer membrane protein OmpA-like peptidoglycan-associated protein
MLEREIKCARRSPGHGRYANQNLRRGSRSEPNGLGWVMSATCRVRRAAAASCGRLSSLLVLMSVCAGAVFADPPAVVDSQSIVRSLRPAAPVTRGLSRGLVVAPRTAAAPKVNLDIRFANDSDQLTSAAHKQLAELGAALNSPELAGARFLIAGHTSASGAPEHNRRLSESRARSVRSYLLQRYKIAPDRLEATGFGSSRPLPDVPPNALQQRRVEISTLPPAS